MAKPPWRASRPRSTLEKHLSTPANPSDADAAPLTTDRILMALVPYALVIVVFGIAALPQVKAALVSTDIRTRPGLCSAR